ncbi:S41 family peptidase [Simiduia agarivorans]|uniref:Tail specific protease domain-containing protein n=1 Tax=Simiduia agarivorans (strain DSM 21679 / JCM 13881 / BCRC 17597 / SA1) TaxID=1117647 RepID=K4KHZ3_SIMAS|nr:S41 family peptidase [Simiduia agarivorans]AFU98729.1 hypothetical protein M5M_07690 [Simiduia agarivorans SA1 = DSM 21679]
MIYLFWVCLLVATSSSAKSSELWQSVLKQDLDAAYAYIKAGHPGYIDEQNPQFPDLLAHQYSRAGMLIPQVVDYDTYLGVMRYFLNGFRDAHLNISDDIRRIGNNIVTAGFSLGYDQGKLMVTSHMPGWNGLLPGLGDELLACDGVGAQDILLNYLVPYQNFTANPGRALGAAVKGFSLRTSPEMNFENCTFGSESGASNTVAFQQRSVSSNDFFDWYVSTLPQSNRASSGYELKDGVLWIGLPSFTLEGAKLARFNAMIEELVELEGFQSVVFDVRGNKGGSSLFGEAIFTAVTGGIEMTEAQRSQLPMAYAQWRISDYSLDRINDMLSRLSEDPGREGLQADYFSKLKTAMLEAKQAGRTWLVYNSNARWNLQDFERMNIAPRNFKGALVLLTDGACVSACLDFADMIRATPGSLHVGETTAADSLYMSAPTVVLPSGNRLQMPLKVWRNRLRGNNEPLVPDIYLDLSGLDSGSVRRKVFAVINRKAD